MTEQDQYVLFERLRNELLKELMPPWWEKWALLGSFVLGVATGYYIAQWFIV
jgi:hypothetical protein